MDNKKPLLELVKEVEDIFIKEQLSAREILMVLRVLETNATLVLVLGQFANETTSDNKG